MRNRVAAASIGFLVLAVLATGCGGGESEGSETTAGPVQVIINTPGGATQRIRRTPSPTPVATPSPLVVCATNPDPAPAAALQVQEPAPNQQVHMPVHVRGWASNVSERGIALAVVDQKQTVVQVNNLPVLPREFRAPPRGLTLTDNTRPFAADVVLNVKEPTPYCLWIYQDTTAAGRARSVVQIPIVILPDQ